MRASERASDRGFAVQRHLRHYPCRALHWGGAGEAPAERGLGVGDQLFFLLSVERKQSGKWSVRAVSGRAVQPRAPPLAHLRPASEPLAAPLRTGKRSPRAACITDEGGRPGRGFGKRGASSLLCLSSHSRCALALGASWRLSSGQWIPLEPVCPDLGLSCPRGPDVRCASIFPVPASISPTPVLVHSDRGTRGSPARPRRWGPWCALGVGVVRVPDQG